MLTPIFRILFIDCDKPSFNAGEYSNVSNSGLHCSSGTKLKFRFNFVEDISLKIGLIFFDNLFEIYKNPVPLGPMRYFLPDPVIISQLIFCTSISHCPIDWQQSKI